MRNMSRRITMADVAREAGVSLMTVSRALNDKDGISQETRLRIHEVIDRLGYRPSSIARGLVTKRTGTIGLVVPDNSNPYFSEVARGVEHATYAEDYNVFLCNTEEDVEREKAVLLSLTEKLVDGIIICSSRLDQDDLRDSLRYFSAQVLVNRVLEDSSAAGLLSDDANGVRAAVRHLISRGHRAIGMLAGPERSFSGQVRLGGFLGALSDAGIVCDPDWVQNCAPMVDTSQEAAVDLLTRHPQLTALVCFNDLVAVGAMKACASLGRSVPEDVAIVGFDDIPLAELVTPPLTTIHVPRYELGQLAGKTVLAQIRGEKSRNERVLPVEFIVRGSAP
jgi:LacI family transcriptional regulator